MLLMSDPGENPDFSSVGRCSRLDVVSVYLPSNANISSRLTFFEQSSSWIVVSLEAKANAAGLNLCISAQFVHHFGIKSGSHTFLDVPGCDRPLC